MNLLAPLFSNPPSGDLNLNLNVEDLARLSQPRIRPDNLFGVSGRTRDWIGLIGDAFLTQAGRAPIYGPAREQEKIAEALQNYSVNPLQAISDIGGINADVGAKYLKEYYDRLKASEEYATKQATAIEEQQNKALQGFAGLSRTGNAANWSMLKPVLEKTVERNGLELPFEIPSTFDPEFANRVNQYLLTPKDAATIDEQNNYHRAQILLQGGKLEAGTKMDQAKLLQDQAEEEGRTERTNIKEKGDTVRAGMPARPKAPTTSIQRPSSVPRPTAPKPSNNHIGPPGTVFRQNGHLFRSNGPNKAPTYLGS